MRFKAGRRVKETNGSAWTGWASVGSIFLSLGGALTVRRLLKEGQEVERQMVELSLAPTHPAALSSSSLPARYPFVSVLVPARNEQNLIVPCLNSILQQEYPNFEVIAIDDNSTDLTAGLLSEIARKHPSKLKVTGCPPPEGDWLGKNNALWQGYQKINPLAEWVLFVDADTYLQPTTLRGTIGFCRRQELDLLSLVPLPKAGNFWPRLLTPQVGKYYSFAAANLFLPASQDPVKKAAAGGAFILARREAYQAVEGHRAVRGQVLEDVELARNFRAGGFTTLYTRGFSFVAKTPYEGLGDFWEGVTKNLFLVAGRSWLKVGFIIAFESFHGLGPFGFLVFNLARAVKGQGPGASKRAWLLNLVAVGLVLALQSEVYYNLGFPRCYALLYPLSALFSNLLLLDSAFKTSFKRRVRWKGREIRF